MIKFVMLYTTDKINNKALYRMRHSTLGRPVKLRSHETQEVN